MSTKQLARWKAHATLEGWGERESDIAKMLVRLYNVTVKLAGAMGANVKDDPLYQIADDKPIRRVLTAEEAEAKARSQYG